MYGVGQGMTTGCAGKADLSLGITRLCHRMSMRERGFSSCVIKSFVERGSAAVYWDGQVLQRRRRQYSAFPLSPWTGEVI